MSSASSPTRSDRRLPWRDAGRSPALWDLETANDRRARFERLECPQHVRKVLDPDKLACPIEPDQIADPGKGRDIRDRVIVSRDPCAPLELAIQHCEQTLALGRVTVAGTLVLVLPAGELMEEADLPEHRAYTAHLKHQPLDRLVSLGALRREESTALVRQVDEDCARF